MSHPTPAAPDSPALGVTVSGTAQKYAAKKKKVLNAEEGDLHDLTQAAGIVVDPEVFKIIVDLLKMNVAPLAVFQTLKAMCAGQRISDTTDTSAASHSTAAAPSEPREESTVVSGKGSKPAAPAPRPAKGGAKIVVYPPGDASSLSQGFLPDLTCSRFFLFFCLCMASSLVFPFSVINWCVCVCFLHSSSVLHQWYAPVLVCMWVCMSLEMKPLTFCLCALRRFVANL
ncbi:mitotic-spindle organizing protein 2 isoform X1 [Denticeps clupeoides]|uniref:mitotic-spindle organizing protein 2 isoform X1 n=1 Tax=Denticeps clupeoides TaxID=299321 RepID=UPI0010A57F75|nr:mitotic-spindle organizing protein 2-like isoform X1 [Denticeps clupeoides]